MAIYFELLFAINAYGLEAFTDTHSLRLGAPKSSTATHSAKSDKAVFSQKGTLGFNDGGSEPFESTQPQGVRIGERLYPQMLKKIRRRALDYLREVSILRLPRV